MFNIVQTENQIQSSLVPGVGGPPVSHDNWRELAEKAAKEQDPEKLMVLVQELNGVLSKREAATQQHRNSKARLDSGRNSIVQNYT